MVLGLIDQKVLADIANAIREQNGASATYKPSEMAAAVLALDGTKAGAGATSTLPSKTGVVSDSVFSSVAAAIRSQNGLDVKYKPSEMGDAIRALAWDTGLKPRALLLSDGTLEFNYLDGRQVRSGSGTVLRAWEVPQTGCAKAADVPWYGSRNDVRRVWIDESISLVSFIDISHWFQDMGSLTEVLGFGNLTGVAAASQLFSGDGELQSVWGAGFDASGVTKCSLAFYGCRRLVGGHLTTAKDTYGKSYLTTGANGLLVDPGDDERIWARGHLYADGLLAVTKSGAADASRSVAASGTFCANARYSTVGGMPWHALRDTIASVAFGADLADIEGLCMDYWFYNCKASAIAFSGWGNVHPVSWEFCFNGCINLETLDLRGLDASTIKRWNYALSGMSVLTTVYVDAGWELAPSLASMQSTFYGDELLVGGNGTAFDSAKTSADMAVVDKPGQAGYLTAG